MKRLNLEKLKLVSDEVLRRSQMATIYGGSGGGTCGYAYKDNGQWYGECGVSKEEALFMIQGWPEAHWCCDSCSSTFYCG